MIFYFINIYSFDLKLNKDTFFTVESNHPYAANELSISDLISFQCSGMLDYTITPYVKSELEDGYDYVVIILRNHLF